MSLKNKIYVRPEKSRLINLLQDIQSGRIRIPQFQRDFVWKKPQRLELFDSLNSGFPIGSLLFWKPQDLSFSFNPMIGPYYVNYQNTNNFSYVLDGFQRISTLFGALTNPSNYSGQIDSELLNDYILYYDLKEEEFIQVRGRVEIFHIPIYKLIDTFEFLSFSEDLKNKINDSNISSLYINRAKNLANQLLDYEIPFVEIIGGDIDDAVEIFDRINSRGSKISSMWMLNALSFVEKEFRFQNEINILKKNLEIYNFQDLPSETILHCIETSTGKIYFDVNLKSIAKDKSFPQLVKNAFQNIEKAVKFLYEEVNVFESNMLPYNLQLIFITEFFRLNRNPSEPQYLELKKWFWVTSYSNYFSIYSLSKQRAAFKQFQNFAKGINSNSIYNDDARSQFKTLEFPLKITTKSVRAKSLLLFLVKNYIDEIKRNNNFSSSNKDFDFLYITKEKLPELVFPVNQDSRFVLPIFNEVNKNQYNIYSTLFKSLFIDDKILSLYHNKLFHDLKIYRKELIMISEANFVNSLDMEYFDMPFEYDMEKEIPYTSIKKHAEKLEWNYDNKTVVYEAEEGRPFIYTFKKVEKLVEYLDQLVVQDVQGEMPLYMLKDNDGYLDYEDLVRSYLYSNYFAEMKNIGWKLTDL